MYSLHGLPRLNRTSLRLSVKAGRGGVILVSVLVRPGVRASEGVFIGVEGIEVFTASRAQDGEANAAVIKALSAVLGVPKSAISLVQGAKDRAKTFSVSDTTLAGMQAVVGALPLL